MSFQLTVYNRSMTKCQSALRDLTIYMSIRFQTFLTVTNTKNY